ncbi:MBL fold metallo-hydrolase [Paracoccus methylarcula]|uniref:MBL fold metallo-hydrolase n=1 Tax=Paracoccus methylarcula TaxID=72022 RepID=A0A422QXE3_9RHOB|nr:MBL fold metallo-hydrolase [Paracoccus methylarcula]RNF34593.1 MBL fold metallo-hydrolase [Paracoccus methylarcula]
MLRVTTLKIGECRAPGWGAGMGGLAAIRFPALATLIETDDATILVDTGYGPAFFTATDGFPARIYRWLTPVTLPEGETLLRQLPRMPDLVMLTHMHGDHVSGLMDLPADMPVIASGKAIAHLCGLTDHAAIAAACPPLLRDGVLARKPSPIETRAHVATGLPGFPAGHDLLGDGRLLAVELPGHGVGQTGLWIPEIARFLIADAAYGRAALRSGRMPPGPVLARLGDAHAYRRTFAALRNLMRSRPDITFDPSHCHETMP